MAARRIANARTAKIWFGDKGVYPIMGIITGGCIFATYRGIRHATTSVDVNWTKEARGTATFAKDTFEAGKRYRQKVEDHMVKDSVNNMQHNAPPIMRPLYNLWKD